MARTLAQFSITQESDGYILHLEDDDGETMEFAASFEQLDLITEAIEEQLEMDEDDALGADEDEDDLPGDDD